MLHINDWKKMIDGWVNWSPKALEKDPPPSILAEMYSFSIASCEANLPHTYLHSMVSSIDSSEFWEHWSKVDWLGFTFLFFLHSFFF